MAGSFALVGRIHSIRLDPVSCAFRLNVDARQHGCLQFTCRSSRAHVLGAAQDIEDGALVGAIVRRNGKDPDLVVERLELLGRVRREAMV